MKYLIIIESYFAGKLVGKELNNFLTRLEKNACLKKEFEAYKKINELSGTLENTISVDLKKVKDFNFDPDIYLDILKYNGPLNESEEDIRPPKGKSKRCPRNK